MRPLLAGAALLLLFLGAVAAMEPVDIELSAKPAPKQAYTERFAAKRKDQTAAVNSLREQESIDELYATRVVLDKLYEELLKSIAIINRVAFVEGKKGRLEWQIGKINMGNLIIEQSLWAVVENTAFLSEIYFQMPKTAALIDRARPARQWLVRFGAQFCLNSGLFHRKDPFLKRLEKFVHPKFLKATLRKMHDSIGLIYSNYELELRSTEASVAPKNPEAEAKPNVLLSVLSNHTAYPQKPFESLDPNAPPSPPAHSPILPEESDFDEEEQEEQPATGTADAQAQAPPQDNGKAKDSAGAATATGSNKKEEL